MFIEEEKNENIIIAAIKADVITAETGISIRQNSIWNFFIYVCRIVRFRFYFGWQGFVRKIHSSKIADREA
jgi:hypothetical protein